MSQRKRKRTRHSSHHFTDNSDVKTLHVGVMKSKFPNYITSSHLQQHFSEFEDDIEKAMIIRDLETKESKGYGLVIFTSHEAAERAMSTLKGTKLRGKFPLFMRFDKKPGSLKSDCVPRNSCELFFRAMKSKLPNYIKKGHIREHFTEFESDIVSVVVVCDRETKQSKGFGFIKFTSHQVAMDAQKKLHGSMLQDKFHLYVSIRKPSASSTSESASVVDNDSSESELTDAFSESECEESEIDDQCTLYVGVWNSKFPNFVNNKHLETHFSDFSEHITSARIIRDRSTHETKGYGFVSFTSATETEKAMKELRSTKLLGKFSLYISHQKSTLHRSGSSVSADITNLKAEKPLDTQMPYSKTFQLRPEAVSLKGLQAAFKAIGSQSHTRVVKQAGQAIVIHGYSLENVENSWKGVKDFVERSLTITKSIQVSCGCAKFLQHKCVTDLQELRKQCEVVIPPAPVSGGSIQITIKGRKNAADEVLSKLRKLSSKCHVESFEMQCPKSCANLWQNRWDRFSSEIAKRPNILIDFATTSTAATEAGKNTVTVLIVGTNQAAVKDLKDKVLKDENCSLMIQKSFRFSNKEFEAVSLNLEKLEQTLKHNHSTVISLQRQSKTVRLQAPLSLEASIDSAMREVKKIISNFSQMRTIVTEHCFEDIVVAMLLTTKPPYCEEIQKAASERSVMVQIQKKPKPIFQLQGSCKEIEAIKQKICSLTKIAERSIDQTQLLLGMTTYHLLSTDAFSKHLDELLEKMFVSVMYPPQQGLLRQQLLRTPVGHMITLQLCVGAVATGDVESDAIIIDLNQAESLSDPRFRQKFREYVQKHGTPEVGNATCHESGSLPCRNVIVVSIPKWDSHSRESFELLFSTYEKSLACSDLKGFGVVSFILLENNEKEPSHVSTMLLLYIFDNFCAAHPKMSIHTIRIVVDSDTSAGCTSIFDKQVAEMKHTTVDSVPAVRSSTQKSSSSSPSLSLQWQWRDDRRKYTSYPPDVSAKLTKTKHSNPGGKCFFKVNDKSYVVDLSTMKQKNLSTGFTRDVQCLSNSTSTDEESDRSIQSSASVQWHYMDDQNVLTPYTKVDSDLIERMFSGISKETTHITINRKRYTFDFTKMKQINSSTRHSRSIQRKDSAACKKAEEESPSLSSENQKLVITFRGPKENLIMAKGMVEAKLKEIRFTTTVPMPKAASNQLQQKLHTIIRKHPVDYRIKEDSTVKGSSPHKPCKVFKIEGPEHAVHKAVTEIQAEIIHFHSETPSVAGAAIEYPQEWVPQTKTTEVFQLSLFSDERCQIVLKLREMLPNARIISVHRIQNKWLWEKYEQSRRRMDEKNAGRVNEKQLFHGSRNTSAEKIYDSEEGFDMRFSSQGMWGQANYFAADASYSDAYAFVKTNGNKELLLARVLTGDSYTCRSDPTLRMPPEKPTTSHSDSNVQLKQLRYDTVNGVTKDTQVFMTYSNDKAYPAYLIVYSTSSIASRSSRSARRLPPMAQPGVGTMVAASAARANAFTYFKNLLK